MPKPKPEPKQRVLLVKTSDDKEKRVTLPVGARLTFGPTIPYGKGQSYDASHGYSLRIYEGKGQDTLVAVICDVRTFWDIDIHIDTLILKREGKTAWESSSDGSLKVNTEVKVSSTFEEEVLKLRG